MVGAVQGIGHGLDGAMHNAADGIKQAVTSGTSAVEQQTENIKHIPLKDPNGDDTTMTDEHLEEFKEILLKKTKSFSDDTDKLADDLIKETEDIVDSTKDTVQSMKDNVLKDVINNDDKTPTHSIDSLKTSSPEPEIEKALNKLSNISNNPSPEPTFTDINLTKSAEEDQQ